MRPPHNISRPRGWPIPSSAYITRSLLGAPLLAGGQARHTWPVLQLFLSHALPHAGLADAVQPVFQIGQIGEGTDVAKVLFSGPAGETAPELAHRGSGLRLPPELGVAHRQPLKVAAPHAGDGLVAQHRQGLLVPAAVDVCLR